MRKSSRPVPIFFVLAIVLAAGVWSEPIDEQAETELLAVVEQLFVGVVDGDDAGLDAATCVGDLVSAQLEREQALGLIADAREPELIGQREDRAREAAQAFVERLLERGQQIEFIDVSRIELLPSEEEGAEMLRGEGEEELEITATGILGLKMLTMQRTVDIEVSRLGARWCIDPLSMQ